MQHFVNAEHRNKVSCFCRTITEFKIIRLIKIVKNWISTKHKLSKLFAVKLYNAICAIIFLTSKFKWVKYEKLKKTKNLKIYPDNARQPLTIKEDSIFFQEDVFHTFCLMNEQTLKSGFKM